MYLLSDKRIQMGLSDRIFGFFLDWTMRSKVIAREAASSPERRTRQCSRARIRHRAESALLPGDVERLTVVDLEDLMPERVTRRIAAMHFPVERAKVSAEDLPFEDNTFD